MEAGKAIVQFISDFGVSTQKEASNTIIRDRELQGSFMDVPSVISVIAGGSLLCVRWRVKMVE